MIIFHPNKASTIIIPLMILVSLIPMILICYIAYSISDDVLTTEIHRNIGSFEKRQIETIDLFIQERKLDAYQLANLPDIQSLFNNITQDTNKTLVLDYLERFMKRSGFSGLVLINNRGKIILSTSKPLEAGKNISQIRKYNKAYNNVMLLMLPYVSYSSSPGQANQGSINIATPVYTNGEVVGVMLLVMNKNAISHVMKQNFIDPNSSSYIGYLSNTGVNLFVSTNPLGFLKYPPSIKKHILDNLRKASLGVESMSLVGMRDGYGLLSSYRYLPELSMGLLATYHTKKLYSQSFSLKKQILTLAMISIIIVICITLFIAYFLRRATRLTEKALLNVLPYDVIVEINQNGYYTPRVLNNVSIIFIDIVNYSNYALKENPIQLTKLLNDIYADFDKLSTQFGIEKIKTMGDAYMGASMNNESLGSADSAILFALECIKAIKIYNVLNNTDVSIRIGINTGNVMSGVISGKKISYDIWGNEVNIAARLEKASPVDNILISNSTYKQIQRTEQYEIIDNDLVDCKGIGMVKTHIISSLKSSPTINF